ncbi:MAG: LytTR family DNA-binding domain-containing protein [Lachnospiraceae bacterium]|nr:LytTR family DNA-binding domain-containing protein [Lachnospiraceae bacterium]
MNVAIVEDEDTCRQELEDCLKQWENQNCTSIHTVCYQNGYDLLFDEFHQMHLIFLDIDLPGISGMETARRLRESNYHGHIIFLTAYSEYAFQGYYVHAMDFLLKPVVTEKIAHNLSKVEQELVPVYYMLQKGANIERIPFSAIIVFATQGHYLEIITAEHTYQQRISFKTILANLPKNFIQCHRTLIVNINHVTQVDGNTLQLTNNSIYPISKPYLQSLQDAFIKCSS